MRSASIRKAGWHVKCFLDIDYFVYKEGAKPISLNGEEIIRRAL